MNPFTIMKDNVKNENEISTNSYSLPLSKPLTTEMKKTEECCLEYLNIEQMTESQQYPITSSRFSRSEIKNPFKNFAQRILAFISKNKDPVNKTEPHSFVFVNKEGIQEMMMMFHNDYKHLEANKYHYSGKEMAAVSQKLLECKSFLNMMQRLLSPREIDEIHQLISHFEALQSFFTHLLTPQELQTLFSLKAYNSDPSLKHKKEFTSSQKKDLAQILSKCIGNKYASHQLSILTNNQTLDKDSQKILQTLKEFSAITQNITKTGQLVHKANNVIQKIIQHERIAENEKLSLEEIGFLKAFAHSSGSPIRKAFAWIESLGLGKYESTLQTLDELQKEGHMLIGQMELKLQKHSNYRPGDLIFVDEGKYQRMEKSSKEKNEKIPTLSLCTKSLTGSIPREYKGKKDRLMSPNSENEEFFFELKEKAASTVLRLKPMEWLSSDRQINEWLEEYGNENLAQKIEKGFQKIFEDIQKKRMANFKNASESSAVFCADIISQTLQALESQLKNELKEFLIEKKLMSGEQADKNLAKKTIFKNPFGDKKVVNALTEERFLNMLIKNQWIERVNSPTLIQQLIKTQDLQSPSFLNKVAVSEQLSYPETINIPTILAEPVANSNKPILPETPKLVQKLRGHRNFSTEKEIQDEQELYNKQELYYKQELNNDIVKARKYILQLKERWKDKLKQIPRSDWLKTVSNQLSYPQYTLKPLTGGAGGAHCLYDGKGRPLYIVKPLDQDVGAFNNAKGNASLDLIHGVRNDIPPYSSVQNETLAYQVAEYLGFAANIPRTEMLIFENPVFHDITDNTRELHDQKENLFKAIGAPDREKICSIQEYIQDSEELGDWQDKMEVIGQFEDWTEAQMHHKIKENLDPQSVENCLIFSVIIGEKDANPGNYRVYLNESTHKWGMKKVDTALCFGENNQDLLTGFPVYLLETTLSEDLCQRILNINVEEVVNHMRFYDKSDAAINAFRDRMALLKELAQVTPLTFKEIKEALKKLK